MTPGRGNTVEAIPAWPTRSTSRVSGGHESWTSWPHTITHPQHSASAWVQLSQEKNCEHGGYATPSQLWSIGIHASSHHLCTPYTVARSLSTAPAAALRSQRASEATYEQPSSPTHAHTDVCLPPDGARQSTQVRSRHPRGPARNSKRHARSALCCWSTQVGLSVPHGDAVARTRVPNQVTNLLLDAVPEPCRDQAVKGTAQRH